MISVVDFWLLPVSDKFAQVSVVVDDIDSAVAKELKELGANLMIESELTVDALKDIDTMMVIVY